MKTHFEDISPIVLDVTLRDGGYLNDWEFSNATISNAISGAIMADVDIIEVGYSDDAHSLPLAAACPPSMLEQVKKQIDGRALVASMIRPSVANPERVLASRRALVDLFRIPVDVRRPSRALELAEQCIARGFDATVNFTSVSCFALDELIAAAERVSADVTAVYLADSRGAVNLADVSEIVSAIRSAWSGRIGYHAHNNQGLAVDTTRLALGAGCTLIDGSIAGVGIGGRNLRLEDAISLASEYRNDLRPAPDAFEMHETELGLQPPGAEIELFRLAGVSNIRQEWVQPFVERFGYETTRDLLSNLPRRNWFSEEELQPYVSKHSRN